VWHFGLAGRQRKALTRKAQNAYLPAKKFSEADLIFSMTVAASQYHLSM
jgi:hypothetical protein